MTYRQRNIPVATKEESESQTDIRYCISSYLDFSKTTYLMLEIRKSSVEHPKPPLNCLKFILLPGFSDPSVIITYSKSFQKDYSNSKNFPMMKNSSGKDCRF